MSGKYSRLFELTKDGVLSYSFDEGRIISANQGFVNILGLDCKASDLEGKLLKEMMVYVESEQALRKILLKKGEVHGYEYHFKTLKGDDRWVISESFLTADPVTGEKMAEAIITDITGLKKAQGKVVALNKELSKTNARLKQMVMKDFETGLYNHRYLEDAMEAEFARAKRESKPVSIIMVDIDYFKSINDVYGHQFGDMALKQFAGHLRKVLRRYDVIVRYGGEEFVIVAPGAYRTGVINLAHRILEATNLQNFGNRKQSVKLRISLSVASYPEDGVTRPSDLLNLAQEVLDKSKEFGGNKVCSSLDLRTCAPSYDENGKTKEDVGFLKEKIDKLTKRANQSLIEAIFAFAKTIELKDNYTGKHVEKTVLYATDIARELRLPEHEIERIKRAAILHDLGKVGISEKILHKKGILTKKEYEEIKRHPQIGVDIIRPIQFLHDVIPLILRHHERWDGKGYPDGLKGEEISVGGRIIAVADVYQALISDRPYRKAFSEKEAIKIIRKGAGTQFDPVVVGAFLKVIETKKGRE
ncbi:MAG: diguanylate cyclase [Candidatus Omnitrophota bacterium]